MKAHIVLGTLAVSVACGLLTAQAPGRGPAGGPSHAGTETTVSGSISQLNYGHQGRVEGFLIGTGTLVNLPPDWNAEFDAATRIGETVKVNGFVHTTDSGLKVVQAQSMTAGGKTLTAMRPGMGAPFTGSGVIRALNYDRRGDVNGFVLDNGTLAMTPPFGANPASVLKTGANVSIAGFAHTSAAGKTVVEVQSITANGQTIAMARGREHDGPRMGPHRGGPGEQEMRPMGQGPEGRDKLPPRSGGRTAGRTATDGEVPPPMPPEQDTQAHPTPDSPANQ